MGRHFLSEQDIAQAQKLVQKSIADDLDSAAEKISQFLEEKLLEKLKSHPLWENVEPIALGSLSRHELCLKSDLDLLFVGPEDQVLQFVQFFDKQGIKLRYRVPEDRSDWTVGVKPFDVLALSQALPLTSASTEKLLQQKQMIFKKGALFLSSLRKAMEDEKKMRSKRHDSISNFLEPNIKYGAGGLRDAEQALTLMQLESDKFIAADKIKKKLVKSKKWLLLVRHILHLFGAGGDQLTGADQEELSKILGYKNLKAFMQKLQAELSEVSFESDWAVAWSKLSKPARQAWLEKSFADFQTCLQELEKDSSILCQQKVRESKSVWMKEDLSDERHGKWLNRAVNSQNKPDFLNAIFRSQLIDKLQPEMARVRGYMQFDHYHRYTLEAHLLQTVLLVLRARKQPRFLGMLSKICKEFKDSDWQILMLTALYHDLAKGKGGDHSTKGRDLVQNDFAKWKMEYAPEVAWLVENHLILSTAAFRLNPAHNSTWKMLFERGVKGDNLRRLTIFTAIDILSTNPEAWTSWKERLLAQLFEQLTSQTATEFEKVVVTAQKEKLKLPKEFIEILDPMLLKSIPAKTWLEESRKILKTSADLEPLVLRNRKKELWIRFHSRKDQPGLFFRFVQQFYFLGLPIMQASINTLPKEGVYDWFQVRSTKTPAQLKKWLQLPATTKDLNPNVKFDRVKVIQETDEETIFSFRAVDQKGLLLAAAKALYDSGLSIRWARVHTWGKQVDDIFGVAKNPNSEGVITRLRESLRLDNPHLDREETENDM